MDIVYILTNEAMPGLVKVGKTTSDLLSRIRALDTTGIPLPFECFFAAEVADCHLAEKLIHDAFDDHRVRKNREFFEIAPERIASALKLAAVREITPTGPVVLLNLTMLPRLRRQKNAATALVFAPPRCRSARSLRTKRTRLRCVR